MQPLMTHWKVYIDGHRCYFASHPSRSITSNHSCLQSSKFLNLTMPATHRISHYETILIDWNMLFKRNDQQEEKKPNCEMTAYYNRSTKRHCEWHNSFMYNFYFHRGPYLEKNYLLRRKIIFNFPWKLFSSSKPKLRLTRVNSPQIHNDNFVSFFYVKRKSQPVNMSVYHVKWWWWRVWKIIANFRNDM